VGEGRSLLSRLNIISRIIGIGKLSGNSVTIINEFTHSPLSCFLSYALVVPIRPKNFLGGVCWLFFFGFLFFSSFAFFFFFLWLLSSVFTHKLIIDTLPLYS